MKSADLEIGKEYAWNRAGTKQLQSYGLPMHAERVRVLEKGVEVTRKTWAYGTYGTVTTRKGQIRGLRLNRETGAAVREETFTPQGFLMPWDKYHALWTENEEAQKKRNEEHERLEQRRAILNALLAKAGLPFKVKNHYEHWVLLASPDDIEALFAEPLDGVAVTEDEIADARRGYHL